MSDGWATYTKNLCSSESIASAAIFGVDDGNLWAQTGLNVTVPEAKTIISGFSNLMAISTSGFTVGGTKYFYITSDSNQIQGKKGAGGVSIARSNKCVIVGTYADGMQPGNARKEVEKMCDYLKSQNY